MEESFNLGDVVDLNNEDDYKRYVNCPICGMPTMGIAKNNEGDCHCGNFHNWHVDNGRVVEGKSIAKETKRNPSGWATEGWNWWNTNTYKPVRQKVVQVSPAMLQGIMTQGRTIGDDRVVRCIEGVPEGAKFITGCFDHHTGLFELVFEHESWPIVGARCKLPFMNVTYQTFHKEWREDA